MRFTSDLEKNADLYPSAGNSSAVSQAVYIEKPGNFEH